MLRNLLALTALCFLGACGDDDEPAALGTTLALAGDYTTTGTWDLSGPFGAERSPGDLVAELLLEEMVTRLGVPSIAKAKAYELLSEAGHDLIADQVDARLPADWQKGGAARELLASTLGSVKRETSLNLSLAADKIALSGSSMVTALSVTIEGTEVAAPLAQIFGEAAQLTAPLTGVALNDSRLRLDSHIYALQLAGLVNWLLEDQLNLDLGALRDQLRAQVDCPSLIASLTSDEGTLTLEVQSLSYTLAADRLAAICPEVEAVLVDSVLGLADLNTSIRLQGSVFTNDSDEDGSIEALRSDSDFSGHFEGFPGPIDPVVSAAFTGQR